MVVGTWIWLKRSTTRFCWCLYEAMSKPHKDILACVFYSCLRTSSSSAGVCWVDLFEASTGLSVSKYGGLKCLPPCDMGNFGWIIGINVLGFEVSPPICGYLVFLLGFEVSSPVYGCLVVYLGFEKSPPICGCLVILGFWYFIPYVISCGGSRCPIHFFPCHHEAFG